MNQQQRALVQMALDVMTDKGQMSPNEYKETKNDVIAGFRELLGRPAPIISLQCAHCQSTIEGLETQVVALRTILETERGFAQQERATTPLTKNQIDLLINGRGDEGDDDYVEPTGDGFGLTDADLVKLIRRVEAHHGIDAKVGAQQTDKS
jgi:hypothetical protein